MEAHRIDDLIEYIESKRDKHLYTWLGQYKESIGQIDEATKYYEYG